MGAVSLGGMRVFAIADPHLSSAHPKPMTVFGDTWAGHPEAFFRGWRRTVADDDLVLVPGDISWAMSLEDALGDLRAIAALPGRKVLLRGNHDYWWPSVSKLRAALPEGMYALQNDALRFGGSSSRGRAVGCAPVPPVLARTTSGSTGASSRASTCRFKPHNGSARWGPSSW